MVNKLVPVWPWPMHPKVAEVLQAIPGVSLVEALPGGPGPVLAIRKAPPFACDAVVVLSPEKAVQGVDIVTGNGLELVTMGTILGRIAGQSVTELASEAVEQKVRFK